MDKYENSITYILNLKAKDLTKFEPFTISKDEKMHMHLYSGSLPLSLDVLKLDDMKERVFYYFDGKKRKKCQHKIISRVEKNDNEEYIRYFTDAIINVTFDRAQYEETDEQKRIAVPIGNAVITKKRKER